MSDPSITLLWLLSGGLFVICAGLGFSLFALSRVLRKVSELSDKLAELAQLSANHSERLAQLPPAPDLAALGNLLRDEWQAFQAIYRSDLATSLAEARLAEMQVGQDVSRTTEDSLERAIVMAQAGRPAKAIVAECGIGLVDAETLVHFHQPRRSLAV